MILRRLPVLTALALLVIPLAAPAQPLADRLPADTVAYVGWAGTDSMGDGYEKSHLKAVLDASNIPAVFTDFLPKVVAMAAKDQPEIRDAVELVKTGAVVYKHPCAYAFTGVDWQKKIPRVVFMCEAGGDADAIERMFKKQLDVAAQKGGLPFPMKVTRSGSLVVWTIGYENPERDLALPKAGAGPGKALIGAAGFKSAFAQVNKQPVIAAYVDVQAVVRIAERGVAESADAEMARNWPKVRDALGLPGIRSAAFTVGFDQRDWVSDVFVDAPAPRKGLLAPFDPAPLDDAAFKAVPHDAISAGVLQFDMAGLLGQVRKIAGEIDPSAPQQIDDAIAQVNGMLEMDVERDLFGSVGSQWAYYSSPSVGGQGILGTAMVNRLKDPAKAEQALGKLGNLANAMLEQNVPDPQIKIRVKQTKVGDLSISYLGTPVVTPAWAIKDGNLYVGLYPQVVASAAKKGAAPAGKSILENPKFTALRQRFGGQPVTSVNFADLQATAPQSYGSWLAVSRLVGFGDVFGVDSPPLVLPELSVLMEHLGPAGSATWSDDAGLHYRDISPFPGSTLLASDPISQLWSGQATLLPAILMPALNRAREQANQVQSMNNLRQIGLATHNYVSENRGSFPNDVADLLKYDLTPNVFTNPRAPGHGSPPAGLDPKRQADWVRQNSDYVYVGAGMKIDKVPTADTVLAYEKPDGLTGGLNILFADGHVEFVQMGRAMQLIGPADAPRLPPASGEPIRPERRPDRPAEPPGGDGV